MRRPGTVIVLFAVSLAATSNAAAQWSISAQIEQFDWHEDTSPGLHESGPRIGLGASWSAARDSGWFPEWQGRIYGGSVDYHGSLLLSGAPANSTSEYAGVVNALDAVYRARRFDFIAGVGWDYWERRFQAPQKETYELAFARTGLRFGARKAHGWHGGAGIKYPFYVRENAHLDAIGFDQNPALRPKGEISLFAELGFRFAPRWSLTGYYDSYRLSSSNTIDVTTSSVPGAGLTLLQPNSKLDAVGLRLERFF